MSKIAIVYGSSTGVTQTMAEKVKVYFDNADLYDVADVTTEQLQPYEYFILGTSTTGVGDLQDDWEIFLPKLEKMNFSGKTVALFGLGDSASFSTSYAGGMSHLYKALKGKAKIVGSVSTDGYTFDDSDSVVDGHFIGLALDEDNEYDKTDKRIADWVKELKKDGF